MFCILSEVLFNDFFLYSAKLGIVNIHTIQRKLCNNNSVSTAGISHKAANSCQFIKEVCCMPFPMIGWLWKEKICWILLNKNIYTYSMRLNFVKNNEIERMYCCIHHLMHFYHNTDICMNQYQLHIQKISTVLKSW